MSAAAQRAVLVLECDVFRHLSEYRWPPRDRESTGRGRRHHPERLRASVCGQALTRSELRATHTYRIASGPSAITCHRQRDPELVAGLRRHHVEPDVAGGRGAGSTRPAIPPRCGCCSRAAPCWRGWWWQWCAPAPTG